MGRIVRLEGDPNSYEVLCETDAQIILVNRSVRLRQRVETLEHELANVKSQLATVAAPPADVSGNQITGP